VHIIFVNIAILGKTRNLLPTKNQYSYHWMVCACKSNQAKRTRN